MTERGCLPLDVHLGFPMCECGHPADAHQYRSGPCRRMECVTSSGGCVYYRPIRPIAADSPAAFGVMVRGMVLHLLPTDRVEYSREETAGMVADVVAQLATQWSGWPRSKAEGA